MKIAVVVRQLDRDHIVWRGRVVRVERAHGIRVVRGVLKMLDVGKHGVIEFGHIWFVAHDHVVTYVFRKDEFVGCCVAHHRARDIESLGKVWRSRSMSPARATQQRRQNRRIVWDDRARMGAAIICELEVSQLGYVRMRMGRVSSTDHGAVVVGLLQQVVFSVRGEVDFRVVMVVIRWGPLHRGAGLEGGQLGYIGIIELRGQMKQVIGVVLGEVDFRIGNMVQVCLEEESRAITVAAQHLSERATHDNVVIRGGRLHRDVFAGCGRGLVRDDRAAAGDWGIGDHNGLGGGDDIPVKDLLDRQRVHRVAVVGECEPAINVSHAERVGSDAPTRVGIAGRVVAGRYRRVMRAATGKTYCY